MCNNVCGCDCAAFHPLSQFRCSISKDAAAAAATRGVAGQAVTGGAARPGLRVCEEETENRCCCVGWLGDMRGAFRLLLFSRTSTVGPVSPFQCSLKTEERLVYEKPLGILRHPTPHRWPVGFGESMRGLRRPSSPKMERNQKKSFFTTELCNSGTLYLFRGTWL
jgi:hypothetical protein